MKDMRKTVLRLWLVIWVITLPLFHIHPEVDHAHGMSGHVHGGTYHSILVNTPVHPHQGYDQEEHHHDGFFSPGGVFGPSHSPSHPPYDFEEATYGFSVIKPTIVLESEKSEFSHDLVLANPIQVSDLSVSFKHNSSPEKRRLFILPKTLSARAPPVLSF